MKADEKKEIAAITTELISTTSGLAAEYKKLSAIIDDEESAIDELDNQDSDSAIARREKCEGLREAVDQLDEAIGLLGEVTDKLGE